MRVILLRLILLRLILLRCPTSPTLCVTFLSIFVPVASRILLTDLELFFIHYACVHWPYLYSNTAFGSSICRPSSGSHQYYHRPEARFSTTLFCISLNRFQNRMDLDSVCSRSVFLFDGCLFGQCCISKLPYLIQC